MTRFIVNNKTELIKLVKIVMIKNKFLNNKNIDLLFKNGFKIYIKDK